MMVTLFGLLKSSIPPWIWIRIRSTWSDGGLTEGVVRFVKEGIVFTEEGTMKLEVRDSKEYTGHLESCSHAEVAPVAIKPLTSGELRTKLNMFRYGRYEVSMKAPSVQPGNTDINGNYIATMFVYRDAKFNNWREIDIEVTGNSVHSVTSNVLNADNTDAWRSEIARSFDGVYPEMNVRKDFNTYAFEWLPNEISWYFNGKKERTYKHNGVPIPDKATKIMMNLWIFGNNGFGGPEKENNRYPFHAEYDWFRFYKWDQDDSYPCKAMDESCWGAGDNYLSSNNPCDGIAQIGECVLPTCRKCTAPKTHCFNEKTEV